MKIKKLIEGTVISLEALNKMTDKKTAKNLCQTLKIFPTPFKGVYYIPFKTERDGFYITYPYKILIEAAEQFLGTQDIYYGLLTAFYFERKVWNPTPAHIINTKLSKKISFPAKPHKNYWRIKKRMSILKQFPYPIFFHRIKKVNKNGIKYKDNIPYASFERNCQDAKYLCKKGSKVSCSFLKFYIKHH